MQDFREIEDIDLKLYVLGGDSFKIDSVVVSPYKIRDIKDFGYSNYMRNLQWLTITIDDFLKSILDLEQRLALEAEKANLKTLDFYTTLGGQEMLEGLMESIAMIMNTEDVRIIEGNVIVIDFFKNGILIEDEDGELIIDKEIIENVSEDKLMMIHRDNFDDFVEAIKIMNYLKKPASKESREENPADDATKELMEQMKRNNERIAKIKKNEKNDDESNDIDISDIISAVTVRSNSINKFNVWDLTLAQLYDEYARLELIDNYDFSIKAMMAGAGEIDLKHWSSRL